MANDPRFGEMVTPALVEIKRNGCYDRQSFKKSVLVQDGWYNDSLRFGPTRQPRMTIVQVRFKPGCQYSLTTPDQRCDGCIHKQELEIGS